MAKDTRRCWTAAKANAAFGIRASGEHAVRGEQDCACHGDDISFNRLKHGYVGRARDWLYSSFRRMVRLRVYSAYWGSDFEEDDRTFGEF